MKFVHLHVHSHYSLLTAPARIEDLLDRAKEFGMEALALTDNSALYGAVEFYMKAKEKGIKPIIGAQVNVCKDLRSKNNTSEDRKRYELVLLAKNEQGYKNLMKIISVAHIEGFYYKPRVDKALLKQYHEGLIALSGSVTGEVPSLLIMGSEARALQAAKEYEDIFGQDNFYLELQPHLDYENQTIANEGLIRMARATGIPLVAANDVHYVRKEEADMQDILLCIQNNWKVSDQNRINLKHLDLSFRSPRDMIKIFKDVPEAIENTVKIADRCDVKLKLGQTYLPHFDVPEGFDAMSYLRHLCELGLTKRYGENIEPKHRERMEYELGVIGKTGFASYFLIVQDFVNWAKDNGIVVGPGRGSAPGSFVAYLTGVTNLDPLEYNLFFERFLNPERVSMPDFDIDLADDRRDKVLNYVREKYGHDHVAQIITFGTMAARAAVRDTGRAMGYPYVLCDQISKLIPQFHSIKKALDEAPDLKKLYDTHPDARKVIDAAKQLEGLCRHASMHACGVVITKEPVTEYTPIQHVSGSDDAIVTQYASSTKSSAVEKIGLLKIDFLGLKNLTIIQNTLRIVKALGKWQALTEHLVLPEDATVSDVIDKLPLDDVKAFEVLQKAQTTGIFQLESNGMKRYLKQLQPTVLEDVIAMVALYRPGPMEWIPAFIDGKHGRRQVEYLHPKLEPILQNTYGVAVYQEQVMQIARDLAGFTLGEADVLRKAMGKKIFELIKEQRLKFVDGCVKNDISKVTAEKVFTFIEPFAGYGFNRSHAACYALIGYQTAYLKAHYPAEFMAALLTSDQSSTDRIAIEVNECREMGITVLPPSVNESFEEFAVIVKEPSFAQATAGKQETMNKEQELGSTVNQPSNQSANPPIRQSESIRFGLNAIKNVGKVASAEIVQERKRKGKFPSIAQFIERVQTKDLNKKSLEALAKVGALDEYGERGSLLASVDKILKHAKNIQHVKTNHATSLFGNMPLVASNLTLTHTAPATKKQKLQWEKELLGLYVSDHPVAEFQEYFEARGTPLSALEKLPETAPVTVGGVIGDVKKIYTKAGQAMYFAPLEDISGRTEILVFPRVAEKTENLWTPDELVLVRGKVTKRDGSVKVIAESGEKVTMQTIETFQRASATKKKYTSFTSPPSQKGDLPADATALQAGLEGDLIAEQGNNIDKIVLHLPDTTDQKFLETLSNTLSQFPQGKTHVYARLRGATIETAFAIASDDEILRQLRELEGVESVE